MHVGSCFCGAVTVAVAGEPEAMGYCHCRSCRSWSGGPVNAFSLWKPAVVRVTSGERKFAVFQKTALSDRTFCSQCGGHLLTVHPLFGLVDVSAATLPTLAFKPGVHVNYAETVLPMKTACPSSRTSPGTRRLGRSSPNNDPPRALRRRDGRSDAGAGQSSPSALVPSHPKGGRRGTPSSSGDCRWTCRDRAAAARAGRGDGPMDDDAAPGPPCDSGEPDALPDVADAG